MLAGIDPIDASDEQWAGALRLVDVVDDIHFIRTVLENTAKESQKQHARPSGLRFRGRRR